MAITVIKANLCVWVVYKMKCISNKLSTNNDIMSKFIYQCSSNLMCGNTTVKS